MSADLTDDFNTDNVKQFYWHKRGIHAKNLGFSRTSPFYENATADYFFFCGFDGVKFEDAQNALKEKIGEALKAHPVVEKLLNEHKESLVAEEREVTK